MRRLILCRTWTQQIIQNKLIHFYHIFTTKSGSFWESKIWYVTKHQNYQKNFKIWVLLILTIRVTTVKKQLNWTYNLIIAGVLDQFWAVFPKTALYCKICYKHYFAFYFFRTVTPSVIIMEEMNQVFYLWYNKVNMIICSNIRYCEVIRNYQPRTQRRFWAEKSDFWNKIAKYTISVKPMCSGSLPGYICSH